MEPKNGIYESFQTRHIVYSVLLAAAFAWPWVWMAAAGSAGEGALVDLISLGTLPAIIVCGIIVYREAKPYPAAYKWAFTVALGAAFLLAWIIPAVGIYGHSGDPFDLSFYGVLAVGAIGALVSRFRPRGMAYTLAAMAVAQMLVSVSGLITGLGAVPVLNALFATLWIVSALLFRRAAREEIE